MLKHLTNLIKNNDVLLYTALGMVFLQGANFFSGVLLARYLSPADFGKFQLLVTLVTTTAIVTKMGLDEGFVYFVPKIRKLGFSERFFTLYTVIFVIIISAITGFFLYSFSPIINSVLLKNIEFGYELSIFSFYLVAFIFFTIINAILRGFEYFNFRAFLVYYLNPIAFLSVILFLVVIKDTISLSEVYYYRIIIFVLIGLVGFLFIYNKLERKPKRDVDKGIIKTYHSFSIALVFLTLIEFLAEQPTIDLLILANLTNAYEIGIYSVNYKIAALLLITYLAFQVIYTSKFSKLFTENKLSELKALYTTTRKKMLVISISLFVLLVSFYDFIILLFGEEYKDGKSIFIILAVGFAFFSMNGLNNIVLIVFHKKKYLAIFDFIMILLLAVAGHFLVSLYGTVGLAFVNAFLFLSFTFVKQQFSKRCFRNV